MNKVIWLLLVSTTLLAAPGCAGETGAEEPGAESEAALSTARVRIALATYGANAGAEQGNATKALARACNARAVCDYVVSVDVLGDPAIGRRKSFDVRWTCGDGPVRESHVDAEANGRHLYLSCGAVPPQPSTCGTLAPGESLGRDQGVTSCDGRTTFVHQSDGNVVVYHDGRAIAATGIMDSRTELLAMQDDGNLVQYSKTWRAMWASNTSGHDGARLNVQDDCDVVIYERGGRPIWHTDTSGCVQH